MKNTDSFGIKSKSLIRLQKWLYQAQDNGPSKPVVLR